MNRVDRVLEYLARKEKVLSMPMNKFKYGKKGITVREANEVLGTTELRKIMSTLRESGYKVITVWEEGENRYGEPVRYKRYFVEKGTHDMQTVIEKLARLVS